MPTYLYKLAKFWGGSFEGWQYGSALPNESWQELLSWLVCKWLKGLTDSWRFLPSILQNNNSIWHHLNCVDRSVLAFLNCTEGSILAFLNCTDGSVLAFLNCTDGSVLTHLIGSYGSVLSHLRFPTQSGLTRFPQSVISLVPWILCKKSNKKNVFEIECPIFSYHGLT